MADDEGPSLGGRLGRYARVGASVGGLAARLAGERYLGWTLSLLPIPTEWNRARALLAPMGEQAMRGEIATDDEILRAVLDAYQLDLADVHALLSWTVDCD